MAISADASEGLIDDNLARRNALAVSMLELFFCELYDWGCLQTDPNFGNYLLALADNSRKRGGDTLVLLDFGSVLDCSEDFLYHLRNTIDAGLRQDITLSWLHDWATRFGTNVDIGYGEDEYRPDGRKDEIWYWGVGARYAFNPHLRLGFSITGYDRTSDEPEFDYQRMVYLLTLEASF